MLGTGWLLHRLVGTSKTNAALQALCLCRAMLQSSSRLVLALQCLAPVPPAGAVRRVVVS